MAERVVGLHGDAPGSCRWGCRVAFSAATALFSSAATAQLDERQVGDALTIDDATSCLHEDVLGREIARWLGRSTIDSRFGIAIRGDSDEMRFAIRRGSTVVGERAFPTVDVPCAEADATLAAAIASGLDAAERTPSPASAGEPAEPAASDEPVEPAPSSRPTADDGAAPGQLVPRERRGARPAEDALDHRFALTAQGTVLFGVLPLAAPSLAPAFEVALTEVFEVRGSALVSFVQEHDVRDPLAGSVVAVVDMAIAGGRLDGCAGFPIGRGKSRARGCAGVLVGSVRTEPVGGVATKETSSPWVAPALRAEVEIPAVPVVGVAVAADLFVPVVRPELVVERGGDRTPLSDPLPAVAGALSFGPFLHF